MGRYLFLRCLESGGSDQGRRRTGWSSRRIFASDAGQPRPLLKTKGLARRFGAVFFGPLPRALRAGCGVAAWERSSGAGDAGWRRSRADPARGRGAERWRSRRNARARSSGAGNAGEQIPRAGEEVGPSERWRADPTRASRPWTRAAPAFF